MVKKNYLIVKEVTKKERKTEKKIKILKRGARLDKKLEKLIHAMYTYGQLVGKGQVEEVDTMEQLLEKVQPVIQEWEKKETFEQFVENAFASYEKTRLEQKKANYLQFDNEVRTYEGNRTLLWIHVSIPGEEEVHMGYFNLEDVIEGNIYVGNFPELTDNLAKCQQHFKDHVNVDHLTDLTWLEGERLQVKIDRQSI